MGRRIVMHKVDGWDALVHPGDYILAVRGGDMRFPIIVCPNCWHPGSYSSHTVVSLEPLTLHPSCRCLCSDGGWHGWVKDGIMEDVE